LVDCRRDHIDRRLNLHYSLDVIFRLSFLVTAGEGFGQGRALVEQLVSRFLKDVHLVLGHDQLSISSGAKFCSALQLLAASSLPFDRISGRFRFPLLMLVHFELAGRQVAQDERLD
jgi:hypothetical protein